MHGQRVNTDHLKNITNTSSFLFTGLGTEIVGEGTAGREGKSQKLQVKEFMATPWPKHPTFHFTQTDRLSRTISVYKTDNAT